MDNDALSARGYSDGDGHLDGTFPGRPNSPKCSSAAVTEHRMRPAGEHGSQPCAVLGQSRATDRVDVCVDLVQAADGKPMPDGLRSVSEPQ